MREFPEAGAEMRYVGPSELSDEWAAPKPWKQPYTFRFVSHGGVLCCTHRFNGRKKLSPDHPANDPRYWEVV